ncbi:PH domain-containing protein [Metabacillus sp. GX 13764]|nr:PH domain-containing protein [Metabacillus kandeliae]
MYDLHVSKEGENLLIQWQLSKVKIPLTEIKEVKNDDSYGGEDAQARRIGYPYGNTDRVSVKTANETYLLFTSAGGLKEKILSYVQEAQS